MNKIKIIYIKSILTKNKIFFHIMKFILIYHILILALTDYSRDDAVNYALENVDKLNHICGVYSECTSFAYFGDEFCDCASHGGDCANFVSQCLVFGGGHEKLGTNCGFAEVNASNLGKSLLEKGWNSTCGKLMEPPSYIKPGDVLIYHKEGCDNRNSHAVIITSVEPSVKFTARSNLRKDEDYSINKEQNYYQWLHYIDEIDDYGKALDSFEYIISIEKIDLGINPCSDNIGLYNYYIYFDINKEISYTEELTFDLTTSGEQIIKTTCTPHYSELIAFFLCDINICVYPLDNVDIFFPLNPPISKKFGFKNWKNIIGASPGISNKISNVNCLPKEENTFTPTSIKSIGCKSNKNIFYIYGNWLYNDKDKLPFFWEFSLLLSNEQNSIANCEYQIEAEPIYIECQFEGQGIIKFNEVYTSGIFRIFKINGFSSDINTEFCSKKNEDNEKNKMEYLKFYSLKYFIISIILIL